MTIPIDYISIYSNHVYAKKEFRFHFVLKMGNCKSEPEKRRNWQKEVPLKREKTVNGIQVQLWLGNIVTLKIDCIVNAANENLVHGAGVAG